MSQSQEYVVRVPRETKKKFHVMRFSAALQVDVSNWKSGRMERENNIKEFKGNADEMPKFGAGSEFGRELKEEARRKKHGYATKKYNPDGQPWILTVNGRNGKKFKGNREGSVSENTSYYVFFQAHDGAFEAFPVSEWYNFTPIPKFKALTAEEAEEKFVQRDKILNYFSVMASKKKQEADGSEATEEKSVKKKKKDFKVSDMDDWAYDSDMSGGRSDESGNEKKSETKAKGAKKGKKGKPKKKKESDDDDDSAHEDSDEGDFDQREVDYMSDSSSEEEEKPDKSLLKGVEDEDALRQLVLSEEEDEGENEEKKLDPNADKNIADDPKKSAESDKVKIKQEKDDSKSESSSSSEDSDDSDFDDAKFQSAMFMQKKVNSKSKNGTESASSSKPNTPPMDSVAVDDGDSEKQPKPSTSSKRKLGSDVTSSSKKQRMLDSSLNSDGITEEAVRRYLMRKPMTTTELLQKFKSKKIPITNESMSAITAILKKLNPEKQKINGKLYLSIKQ